MSRICNVCGKRASTGNTISHSHRKTRRKWKPNLQRVRALIAGAPRRVLVCASCLKAGRITKP